MANNQNIPPDDKDLQLARLIGDALPNLNSLTNTSDAFLASLFQYKEAAFQATGSPNSEMIWNSIHAEINQKASGAKVFRLSPAIRRYAIAAAIIIASFVGSFIYQNLTAPNLIGESFSAMQTIQLSDGSEVTLRPYSRLYKVDISDSESIYKLEGEAYFEVSPNPNRIFSVKTNQSEVQVLGTKFILSDWGNTSTVYLQEGHVRYSSLINKKSVELKPGQASSINEKNETPVATAADETVYTDWLNDELVFRNESVENIFRELEQHFNIQINAAPDLGAETLSGAIQLDTLSAVLKDLELVLDGSFTQSGQNEYTFNPSR